MWGATLRQGLATALDPYRYNATPNRGRQEIATLKFGLNLGYPATDVVELLSKVKKTGNTDIKSLYEPQKKEVVEFDYNREMLNSVTRQLLRQLFGKQVEQITAILPVFDAVFYDEKAEHNPLWVDEEMKLRVTGIALSQSQSRALLKIYDQLLQISTIRPAVHKALQDMNIPVGGKEMAEDMLSENIKNRVGFMESVVAFLLVGSVNYLNPEQAFDELQRLQSLKSIDVAPPRYIDQLLNKAVEGFPESVENFLRNELLVEAPKGTEELPIL